MAEGVKLASFMFWHSWRFRPSLVVVSATRLSRGRRRDVAGWREWQRDRWRRSPARHGIPRSPKHTEVLPTVGENLPHLQVAGGQPDDRGLVQLRRDCCWQRQQLRQLQEFRVLLFPATSRRVLALLLHRAATERVLWNKQRKSITAIVN